MSYWEGEYFDLISFDKKWYVHDKTQGSELESLVTELRTCTMQQEDRIQELNDQISKLEADLAQKPDVLDTEEYQQLKSG